MNHYLIKPVALQAQLSTSGRPKKKWSPSLLCHKNAQTRDCPNQNVNIMIEARIPLTGARRASPRACTACTASAAAALYRSRPPRDPQCAAGDAVMLNFRDQAQGGVVQPPDSMRERDESSAGSLRAWTSCDVSCGWSFPLRSGEGNPVR